MLYQNREEAGIDLTTIGSRVELAGWSKDTWSLATRVHRGLGLIAANEDRDSTNTSDTKIWMITIDEDRDPGFDIGI